jgi:hypothetical protein
MKGKPVIPPVCLTATCQFKHSDDLIDVVQEREGYIYSRCTYELFNDVLARRN